MYSVFYVRMYHVCAVLMYNMLYYVYSTTTIMLYSMYSTTLWVCNIVCNVRTYVLCCMYSTVLYAVQ